MQPLHVYSVVPKLPERLEPLWDLAYNLWFAWNDKIVDLFARIDARLWAASAGNPVQFLNRLPQETLESLAKDDFFLERLSETRDDLTAYLQRDSSLADFPGRDRTQPVVAYFSFEFGLAPCLPIYSGGLGILAGDHLKSASDLNVPLVGLGLCYQQGYFRQYLTPDGWQQERYPIYDFEQLPLALVKDGRGEPVTFSLDLAGQPLAVQIWQCNVGRVRLLLLDSNLPQNPPHFRQITARLYGGNLEMRLWQEILLGVGGIKALEALGLTPMVIHMNEGHSAFAGLERIRNFMSRCSLSFEAAMELVASTSVFTTHTPVPAGNDRFPPELMQPYFERYAQDMGVAFKVFLALGREDIRDNSEPFCMTVLALRLSRFNNGVSHLHGRVSRAMWKKVWPQYPVEDVPIGAITNGVHAPTWVSDDMALLYDRFLGSNWREDPDCARVWKLAENIPDAELWRTHERLRERLVDFVRRRLRQQLLGKGARRDELIAAEDVLNPQAMTIGFARRFATYKRANLLLSDPERLKKLVSDPQRPVQFIFAGKAHPQDNEGKKIIQQLVSLCRSPECRNSMVFLEDYDMEIASYMIQGCDVWLNTPRRPLEACGTSGMKAMANGVLQVSTLDGWWAEAYRPDNSLGWAIGQGEEYEDPSYQDFVESQTLYKVLESDVIPVFYDRSHGNLPRSWLRRIKRALTELGPVFNSHRMMLDYAQRAYLPAYSEYRALSADDFAPAKELAAWRMDMMTKWSSLAIRNVTTPGAEKIYVGQPVGVRCEVHLNGIRPEDVRVEVYAGPLDQDGAFIQRQTTVMSPSRQTQDNWQVFKGTIQAPEPGRFGFTVRILPNHPLLVDPHCLGIIHWASKP